MAKSGRRSNGADADVAPLEACIGHCFRDGSLLELALTHRSRSGNRNNERLEFLGDAYLGFVIGDELFRRHPEAQENALTLMRASLVQRRTLAEVARGIDLGDYLRLGPGELKSGGFRRDSILSDAVEALIGAVLLDAGEGAARSLILHLLGARLDAERPGAVAKDAKTRLQELLQGRGRALPDYEVVDVHGSEHAREFRVACRLRDGELSAEGRGRSRRAAEQEAAAAVLRVLEASSS
ncbi:MAG: ribonuclease III [Pseudomonadales bacterium]|jgi:ribonuclease-3|nr:ribonuclease III [Pseudomonadales bacterium]